MFSDVYCITTLPFCYVVWRYTALQPEAGVGTGKTSELIKKKGIPHCF